MAKTKYGGALGTDEINPTAKTYRDLKAQTTSFDGCKLIVNGTEFCVSQGIAYTIRDAVGSGGKDNTMSLANAPVLAGQAFETAGNNAINTFNETMPSIANTAAGYTKSIQSGIDSATNAVTPSPATVAKIKAYTAPIAKVKSAFDLLMKTFDEWVKTTFIGQIFGIKGSEILCTLFCIIVSFMSCGSRQKLYDLVMKVKATELALKQGLKLGVDLTTTYNGDIVGPNSIAAATSRLFGNKQSTGTPLVTADRVLEAMGTNAQPGSKNVPATPNYTRAALQAPKEVLTIVNTLTKTLKVITKMRVKIPVGINGNIWDLAQAVLYAIQAVVLQMATQFLNKTIKPIEDWIKKLIPDNCTSNMAAVFFNKIIDTIRKFKQWLLKQIKEFAGASNGFSLKWQEFGLNINAMVELLQFLEGLSLVLSGFADFLLACGLTPCNKTPDPDVFPPNVWKPMDGLKAVGKPSDSKFADIINQVNRQNIMDALKSGADIPMSNIPAERMPLEKIPSPLEPAQIDDIARRLAPIMKIPIGNIIVTPQELKFVQPGFENAPSKIAKLIADGVVENNLGPGWTTFVSPDNKKVDVVYTFKRSCGD